MDRIDLQLQHTLQLGLLVLLVERDRALVVHFENE